MKYMGNKRRIATDIINTILKFSDDTKVFVDLFCGSCSITEQIPQSFHRIANDKNVFLIEMWKHIIGNPDLFPTYLPKEKYSKRRDIYNLYKKGKLTLTPKQIAEVGWYGWMGSFNGRFFDGGYSGHEVQNKSGKSRDYITEQINNTKEQIPLLKDVEFHSGEYWELDIPDGAIVYCDIPYRDTKQYDTSKDFDYEKFYDWCRKNKDKYQIFVSEYQMPDDFTCIWSKELTNSMNSTKTYKPIEKLFKL